MKIEHVAIWAKDIEILREFYQTYFNARPNTRYHNPEKSFSSYFLEFETGVRLEIMQMPTIEASGRDPLQQVTGIAHIAFSTGSEANVDELTTRLAADGYKTIDGPRRTGDGYYESVVLDPEGNRIEITV